MTEPRNITISGARVHNLKNISLTIPKDRLVVITGKSGSGKSSLAFDTLYAEGQRRYVESLSAYARQFLEQMQKPDVDAIEGLSPAIAIEQKTVSRNPRSTVATITEIYDYLRVLYARTGTPFCHVCGREIASQTIQEMIDLIMSLPEGEKLMVLSPVVCGRKGEHKNELHRLQKEGFVRARINGTLHELANIPPLDKNKSHSIDIVVDRLVVRPGIEKRLADSLQTALQYGGGRVLILQHMGEDLRFNEKLACPDCGIGYPDISPRTFSFNSPYGACPSCMGLGTRIEFDPGLVVPDPSLSLNQGAVLPWGGGDSFYVKSVLQSLARHYGFSLDTPFQDLPEAVRRILLHGSGDEEIELEFSGRSSRYTTRKPFPGVLAYLHKKYHATDSESVRQDLADYMNRMPCPDCGGRRLRRESLSVKIAGKSIAEVSALTIGSAQEFFQSLRFNGAKAAIAEPLVREITGRLTCLLYLGLGYLTLDRAGATLSGGEAHRIRLATQLGSRLTGVLYVLDEPSVGLHARDTDRLISVLKDLRDIGNTVLVVEHDEQTIRNADFIVDMGPGAGSAGGNVVAAGPPAVIENTPASLTGRYLSGKLTIPVPSARRKPGRSKLTVRNAADNNLQRITVDVPLGLFVCVTGVSGSGKSTLVVDTLYRLLAARLHATAKPYTGTAKLAGMESVHAVVHVDQSPIGRTPRSNPATFTGLFDHIRDLFAGLPEARLRGYKSGRFSFNLKGGRCEACQGDGMVKIEMHFLPDMYVRCDVCQGSRYNRETLQISYRGRSISDVLGMTVHEALLFFENIPQVRGPLQVLAEVGLEYLTLGQQATTLSGGEAQRIKLARELSRRPRGHTLYILDEPTTGLHADDVATLLRVLNSLVDRGNTVVVIEHNLDVVKCADYVIDLGPEGGDGGGRVVATGPPEAIARTAGSHTGKYLKTVLVRQ